MRFEIKNLPIVYRNIKDEGHCRFLHSYLIDVVITAKSFCWEETAEEVDRLLSGFFALPRGVEDYNYSPWKRGDLWKVFDIGAIPSVYIVGENDKDSPLISLREAEGKKVCRIPRVGCESLAYAIAQKLSSVRALEENKPRVEIRESSSNRGGYDAAKGEYFSSKIYDGNMPVSLLSHSGDNKELEIIGGNVFFSLEFSAKELDTTGYVCDFGAMKQVKYDIERMFDHKMWCLEVDASRLEENAAVSLSLKENGEADIFMSYAYLDFLRSGLSLPLEEVKKIENRVEEKAVGRKGAGNRREQAITAFLLASALTVAKGVSFPVSAPNAFLCRVTAGMQGIEKDRSLQETVIFNSKGELVQ